MLSFNSINNLIKNLEKKTVFNHFTLRGDIGVSTWDWYYINLDTICTYIVTTH